MIRDDLGLNNSLNIYKNILTCPDNRTVSHVRMYSIVSNLLVVV